MVERQQRTAILLFSRTSTEETEAKTFAFNQGKKKNKLIVDCLIQQSIKTAKATKLPVFTSYSSQQKGTSFGERLANEIENVFQKGYKSIIVLGNDCPQLTTKHILQAKQQLQQKRVVLGPATDGGVYLIGLQKSAYDRATFLNLAWEKESLQATWKAQTNDIVWLESLSDIDSAADLSVFLKNTPKWHYLLQLLVAILQEIKLRVDHTYNCITASPFNSSALRAPPFLV